MRNKRKKLLIAGLALIAIAVGALIVYRIFFVKMIRVPTGAMANTIIPGDHLIVRKLFGDVNRGDIVIFQYPGDSSTQYVARVVGLPGERIQTRGYFVSVNGVPIPDQRVLVAQNDDFIRGLFGRALNRGRRTVSRLLLLARSRESDNHGRPDRRSLWSRRGISDSPEPLFSFGGQSR